MLSEAECDMQITLPLREAITATPGQDGSGISTLPEPAR
jgi:hypothetical protein